MQNNAQRQLGTDDPNSLNSKDIINQNMQNEIEGGYSIASIEILRKCTWEVEGGNPRTEVKEPKMRPIEEIKQCFDEHYPNNR